MKAISIIGGGRWARTIATVLAGLRGAPDKVLLHSHHNAAGLEHWVAQKNLQARVAISQGWPDYSAARPDAVIVANRAADHVAAACAALDAGIPVLVEKPVAIGADAIRLLCARAELNKGLLAASHVLLFTRYIETFAAEVARQGPMRRLALVWEDGQGDVVRGDVKSYDPAVTVFDDVLPHVLPILGRIAQQDLSPVSLEIVHGGAQVNIAAAAGDLAVSICLARNAKGRSRILTAYTELGPCELVFSIEPGTIAVPGVPGRDADPLWNSAMRPLGAMLTAFLAGAREGNLDARLSPQRALASAIFADALRAQYRVRQQAWLDAQADAPLAARDYALQEISGQS